MKTKQKNKKINTQKLTNGNSGISKNNDKFPSFLVPFGYNFKRHECPCISIYVKQKKKGEEYKSIHEEVNICKRVLTSIYNNYFMNQKYFKDRTYFCFRCMTFFTCTFFTHFCITRYRPSQLYCVLHT